MRNTGKTRDAGRSKVIREVRQVEALTAPLAHRLVGTLERVGPATAAELAEYLGTPTESLYYHLRKLVALRVLDEVGERPTDRRPERVFALASGELVLDPKETKPRFLRALAKLQRSLLSFAVRRYEAAVHRPESVRAGASRNLCVIQQQARLGKRDLAEWNRRLEELAEFLAERDDPRQENFLTVTISVSPEI